MAKKTRKQQEQTPLVLAAKLERRLKAIDAELDRRIATEKERSAERLQNHGADAQNKRAAALRGTGGLVLSVLQSTGAVSVDECRIALGPEEPGPDAA
jgi:hypothetical protein